MVIPRGAAVLAGGGSRPGLLPDLVDPALELGEFGGQLQGGLGGLAQAAGLRSGAGQLLVQQCLHGVSWVHPATWRGKVSVAAREACG